MRTNQISEKLIFDIQKEVKSDVSKKMVEEILGAYVDYKQSLCIALLSPESVYERYKHLAYESNEVMIIAVLDSQMQLVHDEIVYRALKDKIEVDPGDVLKVPLLNHGKNFMIIHNHPSGSPYLSDDDLVMASAMSKLSTKLGLNLIDSITIATEGFDSVKQNHGTILRHSNQLEY